MKKAISKILLGILVMIMVFSFSIVKADEEEKTETAETEKTAEVTGTEEKKEEQTTTAEESVKAKVIEAGDTYERENGSGGTETVQDVKVKILEGKNKDEKFSATYVLTYDLDNKIVGYKLREGNTVFVGVSEENGNVKVTIQDIVREKYLIGLVVFFFASILLIGRKKGLKSIIGLVITILAIFFILVATIFKGYNAILVSIGTSFLIIVLTFAIIGGWNKKTLSAALGTLGGVVLAGVIASITGYLAQLSGAGKE